MMQMSREVVYVFVEGYTDRYLYSRIADCECRRPGIPYRIVPVEEVLDGEGGKRALLRLFDFLSIRSALIGEFKGKTTVCIFFLDKDLDDFSRSKRKSQHIVYTKTYELANYFFMHGDLTEAAAASGSLDTQSIGTGLGDWTEWRHNAAIQWKEWVKLCFFSQMHGIQSEANYGCNKSRVNKEVYGPVDRYKCKSCRSILKQKSGLSAPQFRASFARMSRKVDRMYREGQHDLVFKGTWYAHFLAYDIGKIANSRHFDSQRLEKSLLRNLPLTLDLDEDWADHFRLPIRTFIAKATSRR